MSQPDTPPPSAPRAFTFRLTADDLTAAYLQQNYVRLRSPPSLVVWGISLLSVVTVIALEMAQDPLVVRLGALAASVAAGAAMVLALLRWRVPALARRIWRQQRNLRDEIAIEWDDLELRVRSDQVQSRLAWADYVRWREDRRTLLLYQSDALFQMLPKRLLPPGVLEAFRSHAAAAGVKGAARAGG